MANRIDREDYAFLKENARQSKAIGLSSFIHLDQPIGWLNYIRIANDIRDQCGGGRLLDWGCGFGQMTYLLRRRGLEVTPFDIGSPDASPPPIPLSQNLEVVRSLDETRLPFLSGAFDAVLSCGVLEHVEEASEQGDERLSLAEIHRVLRPGGLFFIYQLPQRLGWQEAFLRKLQRGYTHPRRYTSTEIRTMLEDCGFTIVRLRRSNLIPHNLTGVPERVRLLYSRASKLLIAVDRILCRIAGLNRFAGVLEVTAQTQPSKSQTDEYRVDIDSSI